MVGEFIVYLMLIFYYEKNNYIYIFFRKNYIYIYIYICGAEPYDWEGNSVKWVRL